MDYQEDYQIPSHETDTETTLEQNSHPLFECEENEAGTITSNNRVDAEINMVSADEPIQGIHDQLWFFASQHLIFSHKH